jgi:uncharacterized membrane protein YecN with MAPEG domain
VDINKIKYIFLIGAIYSVVKLIDAEELAVALDTNTISPRATGSVVTFATALLFNLVSAII